MQEEVSHVYFGAQQLKALIQTPDGYAEALAAVIRWLPRGLDMFGRSGSTRDQRFIHWGLKHRANEQARQEYQAEVEPLLQEIGLEKPDPTAEGYYL